MISKPVFTAVMFSILTSISSAAQNKGNYDEAKVGQYSLPDPLRMENGDPVKDAKEWREKRRPEILHLFETHVYGRSPDKAPNLSFEKTSEDKNALGGTATRREISIYLTKDHSGPRLDLLVYVPNAATRPVPAFLGLNFEGNQTVNSD